MRIEMNVVIIYCVFSIILWITVILYIRKVKKDNLHPVIILLLFYILNYPIKMIATKYGIFLINSNVMGDEKQIAALALSDFSMLLLCGIFFIKPKIKGNLNNRLWPDSCNFGNAFVFFLFLFIFSAWAAYGTGTVSRMFSLASMMDYRAYRLGTGRGGGMGGLFGTIMTISMYSLSYLGIIVTYKKPLKMKIIFLIGMVILTWYAYAQTLAKTTLLMTPIVLLVSFHMCSKRNGSKGISLKVIGIIGTMGLLAVAVMELTDVLAEREITGSKRMALLNSFFNPSFDVPDNLTAILERIDNIWLGELSFRPFLYNLFLSKIPRALWPGKSVINGKIMIVKSLLPEFYVSNTNYNSASPSIVGDALASGGIFFVIVISVVYGILFYNLYRAARNTDNLISNLLYLFLISNFNNFCRGGSDILGNLIYYYILICAICIIYRVFGRFKFVLRSGSCTWQKTVNRT